MGNYHKKTLKILFIIIDDSTSASCSFMYTFENVSLTWLSQSHNAGLYKALCIFVSFTSVQGRNNSEKAVMGAHGLWVFQATSWWKNIIGASLQVTFWDCLTEEPWPTGA